MEPAGRVFGLRVAGVLSQRFRFRGSGFRGLWGFKGLGFRIYPHSF